MSFLLIVFILWMTTLQHAGQPVFTCFISTLQAGEGRREARTIHWVGAQASHCVLQLRVRHLQQPVHGEFPCCSLQGTGKTSLSMKSRTRQSCNKQICYDNNQQERRSLWVSLSGTQCVLVISISHRRQGIYVCPLYNYSNSTTASTIIIRVDAGRLTVSAKTKYEEHLKGDTTDSRCLSSLQFYTRVKFFSWAPRQKIQRKK